MGHRAIVSPEVAPVAPDLVVYLRRRPTRFQPGNIVKNAAGHAAAPGPRARRLSWRVRSGAAADISH